MWAGNAWRAALFGVPRGCRAQSALAQLRGILEGELEGIRGAGTWKSERVITSRQGPHIHVDGVSGGNSPSRSRSKTFPELALEWRAWRRGWAAPTLLATGPLRISQGDFTAS